MKEHILRKMILSSSKLDSNEKVLLLALCLRVDWETWRGPVAVSNLKELTSMSERNIRRIISKLVEKKAINRVSMRDKGAAKNRVSMTKINLNFFDLQHDKVDTDKVDTDRIDTDKVDTDKIVMDEHDKVVIDEHDRMVPHTISNNNIQYSLSNTYNSDTREEEEEREVKKVYSFLYPSSITDPEERKRVEDHIKKNYHRLLPGDRQRLLYPDLAKPLI